MQSVRMMWPSRRFFSRSSISAIAAIFLLASPIVLVFAMTCYVDKRGVNPKIIRSTEEVNKMEQAEQAKADQQAMMQQALEGAKTLNEIAPGSLANMGGMQ